jgi:hypothetical protein
MSSFYEAVDNIQKTEVAKVIRSRIAEIDVTLEMGSGDLLLNEINELEEEKDSLSKLLKKVYQAY